jgi:predicted regulator of Ras-like GTPase activity (Roadblock/LC7/MglB family)
MIQTFLILKRTGENIYKKSFGTIDMDETVMSGFFSAFFTFTQSLCRADIQDIELGQYRILFDVVGSELILCVIFDKSDSIISVGQILTNLKSTILSEYSECIKKKACNTEDFVGLGDIIAELVSKPQFFELNDEAKSKYEKIIQKLHSANEILDCALISIEGIPVLDEGKKEFLDIIIKQLDAFWKFKSEVLDQIILYYEQRYIILHKINDNLILSCFFRRDTPIGLATLLVEEAATKISNIRV